jgi:hypothetical protein
MITPDKPNAGSDESTEAHVRARISDEEQAATEPRRAAPMLRDDESTEGHIRMRDMGDADTAVNRDIDEQSSRPQ